MTRRQHRRWKQKNKEEKKNQEVVAQERPEWADEEKEQQSYEEWRHNFMMECNPSYRMRQSG